MMAANQRSDNDEAVGGEGDQALRRMEELARETAVGDTMYEKRWVIENLLEVGRHFQENSYEREVLEEGVTRLEVLELETFPGIEDKMCTLWDISVEEDVSEFFLEYGALDVFVELFSNPNKRVKEIAVGLMTNMVCHKTVFHKLVEKERYLEKLLKLLEVQDAPTLALVFRCLHTYGYNLFELLHKEQPSGPQLKSGSSVDSYSKERAGDLVDHWLIYMAAESVVQNIGVIVASSTNKDVLGHSSRLLSVLSSLWEDCQDRRKVVQHYAEETFVQCVLEAMEESVGEDKTEKHLMIFLTSVCEQDMEKEVYAALSDLLLGLVEKLFTRHVLQYSSVDGDDLEFVSGLCWVLRSSLDSGGYSHVPKGLQKCLVAVQEAVEVEEEGDGEREEEGRRQQEERRQHRESVGRLVQACLARLRGLDRAVTNGSDQGEDGT